MDDFIDVILKSNFKDRIKYLKMKLTWDPNIFQQNQSINILEVYLQKLTKLNIDYSQKEIINKLINSINNLNILEIFKEFLFDFFIDEIWFNNSLKETKDKIIEEKISKIFPLIFKIRKFQFGYNYNKRILHI